MTRLALELHLLGVGDLFMEARELELNRRDVRTIQSARFALSEGARFQVHHRHGLTEPLFWAADIVAGVIRAHHQGNLDWRALLDRACTK